MTLTALGSVSRRALAVSRFAWVTLVYAALVELFGAAVRITGSDTGCGQYWPTCWDEFAHVPRRTETWIEVAHRGCFAVSCLAVVVLFLVVRGAFNRRHLARRAARAALGFMVVEFFVRFASVLLGLIGSNDSVARALAMALHLVNAFLLTGSLALVAWSSTHPSARLLRQHGAMWFALMAGALLLVSASGSTTALGDAVRPPQIGLFLAERGAGNYSAGSHFLDSMRALHPALAVSASFLMLAVGPRLAEGIPEGQSPRLLNAFWALVLVQVAAGVVTIWLSAPGWMQMFHLALAMVIWTLCILAWAAAPKAHRRQSVQDLASRPPNNPQ